MSARVCIGVRSAPLMVSCELRLNLHDGPFGVTRYGPLETEDGKRRFDIETARAGQDMLVVARSRASRIARRPNGCTNLASLCGARAFAEGRAYDGSSITPT